MRLNDILDDSVFHKPKMYMYVLTKITWKTVYYKCAKLFELTRMYNAYIIKIRFLQLQKKIFIGMSGAQFRSLVRISFSRSASGKISCL